MKSINALTLNEATITIEEVNTFIGLASGVPREAITASESVGLRVALLAVEQNDWIKHLLGEITKLAKDRDEAEAKYQAAHESLVNAERDLGQCREVGNDQRIEIDRESGPDLSMLPNNIEVTYAEYTRRFSGTEPKGDEHDT